MSKITVIVNSKKFLHQDSIEVFCNGEKYPCKFGKRIRLPIEVVEILENAKDRFNVIRIEKEEEDKDENEPKKGRPKKIE
ncbi:MAG: hypothetical protein AB1567_08825 [bacterium]